MLKFILEVYIFFNNYYIQTLKVRKDKKKYIIFIFKHKFYKRN
jgi:hypothetical protein